MISVTLKCVAAASLFALTACGPGATVSKTAHVFGGASKGGVDQVTACTRGGIEGKSCGMYVRNDRGEIHMVDKMTGDTVGGRAAMAATPALIGAVGNYVTATTVAKEQNKRCGSNGCGGSGSVAQVVLQPGAVTAGSIADSSSNSSSTTTGACSGGTCLGGMD